MLSRVCFWKESGRDSALLTTASEDSEGQTRAGGGSGSLRSGTRHSLGLLGRRSRTSSSTYSSLSPSRDSFQSAAMVEATRWNEIECTHSEATGSSTQTSLGSLATHLMPSGYFDGTSYHETDTLSMPSTLLTVSFDEKYAHLLVLTQERMMENGNELDETRRFRSQSKGNLANMESMNSAGSEVNEDETNDGYKADDDAEASDEDPGDRGYDSEDPDDDKESDCSSGFLETTNPHAIPMASDMESLAERSEATDTSRMIETYNNFCCAGQEFEDDDSSDSSV